MSGRKPFDPAEKARRAYLENRVRGADQQELLVMLYEGLTQNVMAGEKHLRAQEWEPAHDALVRSRRIVTYLLNSLREEGGDITKQLRGLYGFCFENIGRANLEKNPEVLAGVLDVINELSGAWRDLAAQNSELQEAVPVGADEESI
ncbi:MAG: flagellar export chaperone FliS [bacterium]|nr:flagellar export chaperone FliS [bacterium]